MSLGFHSPRGYLFEGGDAFYVKVLGAFALAPTSSQIIVLFKHFIPWICLFFGWILWWIFNSTKIWNFLWIF
jgi:TM2 domain-containing membrane protein YozV